MRPIPRWPSGTPQARLLQIFSNREIWQRAMLNCPAKRANYFGQLTKFTRGGAMGVFYGQQACLAHLLGYRSHHGVYNGWYNGSFPKGDRAKMLELFAGPDGPIWVKLKMLKLKMDLSKYPIWPAFGINAPAE